MSTSNPAGLDNERRKAMNVYEIVTNRIMELLEQGEIPWKKPWKSTGGPRNLISKKHYAGINQFLLNCSPYSSPWWLTYRQAADKGGHIRRGEKSTLVVFWKWINTTTDTPTSDESLQDTPTKIKQIPILKYYNCFNLEQTEGIPHPPEEQITHEFTAIERAEQIIQNMPNRPPIHYGGDRAFYSPPADYVQMPNKDRFVSSEEFYSVCNHELIHSVGHSSRLGRKGVMDPSSFNSHERSQEELVAEFGASMLCGHAGIEQQTIENSAAYIQGWLSVLKNDKKLAIIAAGQAQKACNYILNIKEDTNSEITD